MLDTNNSSGVVGATVPGGSHRVEMLIGTFVHSVGRDVSAGEVVEVSDKDYRFLKPYEYCKDFEEVESGEFYTEAQDPAGAVEEAQTGEAENTVEDVIEDLAEKIADEVEVKVESKRKKADE